MRVRSASVKKPRWPIRRTLSAKLPWPLAIPAIINASKVNTLLAQGDIAGAQNAAAESKKWSKLALIVGISLYALCCIFYIFVFGTIFATT